MCTKFQTGETLIEVLMTTVVMAIGVLGMTKTQIESLKLVDQSFYKSIVVIHAEDMQERMRANVVAAKSGAYVHSVSPSNVKNCQENQCSFEELAEYDVYEWSKSLAEKIPTVTSSVVEVLNGDSFTITIQWDEDNSGSNGTNCPKLSEEDLDCYQMFVRL